MRTLAVVLVASCLRCTLARENRVIEPRGDLDAGLDAATLDAASASDGTPGAACDLSGRWIVVQVTHATAFGATQKTLSWYLHEIEQQGDTITIVHSLSCGFRVTGTTTVTLGQATLEALARKASDAPGRKGRFAPTASGACALELERTFHLRGANLQTFLTDPWTPGDPLELDDFPPLPANTAAGMEDWDGDQKEGITLSTGLGPRYVAQRDRNEEHGVVPAGASAFGGEGVVVVDWDVQERVSTQTAPLLQIGATPLGPGFSRWKRVGDELVVVTSGAHPELETCRHVQELALSAYPDL
jgi:hypothetical protein